MLALSHHRMAKAGRNPSFHAHSHYCHACSHYLRPLQHCKNQLLQTRVEERAMAAKVWNCLLQIVLMANLILDPHG